MKPAMRTSASLSRGIAIVELLAFLTVIGGLAIVVLPKFLSLVK